MPLLKPCLDCGTPSVGTRCQPCTRQHDATRRPSTAERGYGAAWQAYSRAQIASHPWCTDCGATTDLTTDHGVYGEVVCRACNTRRRAVRGGR